MPGSDEFTCSLCHHTFKKGWTEEEAHQEAEKLFGYRVPWDEIETLCDDCYDKFKAWVETLTPEERAEADRETLKEAES